jgi:hypothetical protein
VAPLDGGFYFSLRVAPGEHLLQASPSKAGDPGLKVDAKPGETYYLRVKYTLTGPEMELVSEPTALQDIHGYLPLDPCAILDPAVVRSELLHNGLEKKDPVPPVSKHYKGLPSLLQGKALIFILRLHIGHLKELKAEVTVDHTLAGSLTPGSYLAAFVAPGRHTLEVGGGKLNIDCLYKQSALARIPQVMGPRTVEVFARENDIWHIVVEPAPVNHPFPCDETQSWLSSLPKDCLSLFTFRVVSTKDGETFRKMARPVDLSAPPIKILKN